MKSMTALKRVMIVNATDGYGGGEFYARDLARGLELAGLTTHTFVVGRSSLLVENLSSYGLQSTLSDAEMRVSRPLSVLRNALRLRKLQRRFHADLIISNLPRAVLLTSVALPRHRLKTALLHSPLGRGAISSVAKHLLRSVLTNTAQNADALSAAIGRKPVMVLEPVADIPSNTRAPVRDLVTMIGRFQEYKGHLDFVRVASEVHDAFPELKFRIFGSALDGTQQRYLESVIQAVGRAGLSDVLEVRVGATSEEIQASLARTRVYVHPARFEDFGISVVEALSSGCLVSSYDAAGPAMILGDKPIGRVVPVTNSAQLSASTVELLRLSYGRDGQAMSDIARGVGSRHSFGVEYSARCIQVIRQLAEAS